MAIRIEITGSVGEVIIDNPPVNALGSEDWFEFATAVKELGERNDIHCLVIRAEGKGFQAGVDIKELAEDGTKIVDVNRGCYDTFAAIGLQYGPGYRTLAQGWSGEVKAMARLQIRSVWEGTAVHPADLDDALCAISLAAGGGDDGDGVTRLPFAVDDARLQAAVGGLWAVHIERVLAVT